MQVKPPVRIRESPYYFTFNNTEVKLIRYTLEDNGFTESPLEEASASKFSILWSN